MGLEIIKQLSPPADSPATIVVVEEKLWLDASRENLLPDGHPDATFLFAVPGQEILREEAARYGLIKGEKKPAAKAAEADNDAGGSDDGTPDLPEDKAKREVWDAAAKELGLDPAEHKKKAELVSAVKAKAAEADSDAGKEEPAS